MIVTTLEIFVPFLEDLGYVFCNFALANLVISVVSMIIMFHRSVNLGVKELPKLIYEDDKDWYERHVPGHEITIHEWKRNRYAYNVWEYKTDRSIPFREWFRQQNEMDYTLINRWRLMNGNILPNYPGGGYTMYNFNRETPMTAKERAELKRKGKWEYYDL